MCASVCMYIIFCVMYVEYFSLYIYIYIHAYLYLHTQRSLDHVYTPFSLRILSQRGGTLGYLSWLNIAKIQYT